MGLQRSRDDERCQRQSAQHFPGRRVGGGSRGECSATLVHLVPETSVYAPDASGLVGLLQGPSNSPVSLQVTLKPEDGSAASTEMLAAGPASVVLFDMQAKRPVVWESSFSCGSREDQDSSDLWRLCNQRLLQH